MVNSRRHSFLHSRELFPLAPAFRIVEIGSTDARRITDNLGVLKALVVTNENMYPGIARWLRARWYQG